MSDDIKKIKKMKKGPLGQYWEQLEPGVKRKIAAAGILLLGLAVVLIMYPEDRGKTKVANHGKQEKVSEIVLEKNIEDTFYRSTKNRVEQQQKELEQLRKQLEDLKNNPPVKVVDLKEKDKDEPKVEDQKQAPKSKPVAARRLFAEPLGPPVPPVVEEKYQLIGGIKRTRAPQITQKKTDTEKKSTEQTIYLPPSFMAATTLSGMAAPTTKAGQNNPLPILIRVQNMAVLPNKVKANLKGCFVIGSGYGQLADERIHIRLNTLSCITRNGKAIIDQAIKGFVVDADGRVGMKGRPVAKMGVHIMRSALAGLIDGIGEGISLSTQTTQINTDGTISSVLTENTLEKIATAGIGKGISKAADELQKFYLELASQTLPVIEVGSARKITVVISEGVELKVMKKG